MRLTRLLLLLSAVAALAGVAVPAASALTFPDDLCPVASGTVVKVCPTGFTGTPYSLQMRGREGTGCVPYVTYRISGGLPPGLSMTSSGLISGTPTQVGEWTFFVVMQDVPASQGGVVWCGDDKSTERQFSIQIQAGLQIQQASLGRKSVNANAPFSFKFTSNGSSAATWTATTLPAGLTLASDGTLSGTPTTPGDYKFTVTVHDGDRTASHEFTLSVVEALKITQATVPAAEVGVDFSLAPSLSGGRAPHTWSVDASTPLPEGLTIDAATGAITGQPTAAGSFPLKLVVTDSLGNTDSVTSTIKVAAPLALNRTALPTAKVGKRYSGRITTTGGVAPRHFVILGGRPGLLPAGIRFNTRTGVLSGVAKKAGTFRLRIQAVDKLGVMSSAGFVIKVKA